MNRLLTIPDAGVTVRPATIGDVPFIDRLQKTHSRMVGFMPNGQLAGKIDAGDVLIAVDGAGERVGYVIGTDRYFKHDDVGIIYHLNVVPGKQRAFVGSALLKAQFDRSAYGCRLYCCWCAQDIEANRFWEAMGFVPLAYRAGSEKKARVHIFWQKRIREGDRETPWWFPSQTTGGAIREDRLVLPIPPGKHWSDEMPVLLPQEKKLLVGSCELAAEEKGRRPRSSSATSNQQLATPATKRHVVNRSSGLWFAPPPPPVAETSKAEKPKKQRKPKRKNDPALVSAARELRDRWLERVNSGEYVFEDSGKYDVSRALPAMSVKQLPALPPAA